MLENILPEDISKSLSKLNYSGIYELRLRVNKPVTLNYFNSYYYLGENGLSDDGKTAIIATGHTLDGIIHRASNFSIYAVNEQLKSGFISINGGIRIGVVGEIVFEQDKLLTVKNFNALNIRIPHEIKGIAGKVLPYLFENEVFLNTLIISPPGAGKTTLLRDLVRELSGINYAQNILLLDERNEIASVVNSEPQLDVGVFTDIMSGGNKQLGFVNGIRSMSPDIIATDELGNEQDISALELASTCGVSIIATIHAKSISDILNKASFKPIVHSHIFKRYIVMSTEKGRGTIEGIYNEYFDIVPPGV